MVPKKTSAADLENIKFLTFNIGLFISLLIVVMAFEWKQPITKEKEVLQKKIVLDDQIQDIPVTEIPPPPPPKVLESPQIVEVPDEKEIQDEIEMTFDAEITELTPVTEFTIVAKADVVVQKEDPNEIFLVVEESASPKGGMTAFYEFVGNNLHYPEKALRLEIEGRVFVQFVVNKDGRLTNFSVLKGIGFGCDEEAVRVLGMAPAWNPGKQRGRPVRQQMVMPIVFKMHKSYM